MRFEDKFDRETRARRHAHSPHKSALYRNLYLQEGMPISCQFCAGQTFRRSTLRATDLTQIFLMRYPVRCLRCGQRQMVSFTVAGISLPSTTRSSRAEPQ